MEGRVIYKSALAVKNFDDVQGIIEGYANVYNVKDSDGDISLFGSFAKTIGERGKKIKLFKNHWYSDFIGVPTEFDLADPFGLRMVGKINMETATGKDAFTECKFLVENGFESGFSVGGWIVQRGKNQGEIAEWKLKEVSLLTVDPANALSLVDTVKSVKGMNDLTQEEFWKVIEKAYNEKFSDKMLKSLEIFLSLKGDEPGGGDDPNPEPTPIIEPIGIIQSVYGIFANPK